MFRKVTTISQCITYDRMEKDIDDLVMEIGDINPFSDGGFYRSSLAQKLLRPAAPPRFPLAPTIILIILQYVFFDIQPTNAH